MTGHSHENNATTTDSHVAAADVDGEKKTKIIIKYYKCLLWHKFVLVAITDNLLT